MIFYGLAVAFFIRTLEYLVSFTEAKVFDARGFVRHILCLWGGVAGVAMLSLLWWQLFVVALVADLALIVRELLDVVVDSCRVSVLSRSRTRR